MLKLVVIDDDPSALSLIRAFVNRLPGLSIVAEFNTITPALSFLQTQPIDLLLLDIGMPDGNGFGLLDSLPNPPAVVLITASLTDSLRAYDYGVVDYLVKSFTFERFEQAIDRVRKFLSTPTESPMLALKTGRDTLMIRQNDVRYVKADGPYCHVFLEDRSYLVNHLLADLEARLPASAFIRVHRSYVVAKAHVTRLSLLGIELGNYRVPVGIRYRNTLKKLL